MVKRRLPLILAPLALVAWFLFLAPPEVGGATSLVVVSGTSMQPNLQPGDLVIARAHDAYALDDVAVYDIPDRQPGENTDARIVHRLIAGDGDKGFSTQGDNLDRPDPWTPAAADIVGSVVYRIPRGGIWLARILQPALIGSLAGGLTVFLVVLSRRRKELDEARSVVS
jgi:signal peptidase